jgi:hypothetical protein
MMTGMCKKAESFSTLLFLFDNKIFTFSNTESSNCVEGPTSAHRHRSLEKAKKRPMKETIFFWLTGHTPLEPNLKRMSSNFKIVFYGEVGSKIENLFYVQQSPRNNLTKILISEHMRSAIEEYRKKFEGKEKKPWDEQPLY